MTPDHQDALFAAQRNELTEHIVYGRLARSEKDPNNRKVLARISADELRHYGVLEKLTGAKAKPHRWKIVFYYFMAKILGLTFAVKLMEAGEPMAQKNYLKLSRWAPTLKHIARDEDTHERLLINLLDEDFLKYVSSIVLGVSDALVELTGAMSGIAFALQANRLVALTGLVTGVAAALSMVASEYLSKRHDQDGLSPVKASLYTGVAYLFTVGLLVFPYLALANPFHALGWMFLNAVLVIAAFNFYLSVALEQPFWSRFLEMAGLTAGVGVVSFGIGVLARHALGVTVG